MLNLQIFLIFIAIAAIIIFAFLYSYDKNKIPAPKFLDKKDKLILLGLFLVSSLLMFGKHSSFTPYKSTWEAKKPGDKLVLQFSKPQHIAKIFYSVGFTKGDYSIYSVVNGKKIFIQPLANESSTETLMKNLSGNACVSCFRNVGYNIAPKIAFESLTFQIKQLPVNLGEILILDKYNNVINYTINGKPQKNSSQILKDFNNRYQFSYLFNPIYDEAYYIGSAYEYLNNLAPDVGEHPQLAILLTAVPTILLGFSPFAWRIIPNIMGILLVLIMYIFAKKIFSSRKVAFISSILLLLDPMHLVITKLAILDSYATFFLFCAYYFLWSFYNNRINGNFFKGASINLLYVGIFWGLAISSKWNALFAAPAIFATLFYCEIIRKDKFSNNIFISMLTSILTLILLPALIYVATYIPIAKYLHVYNISKFVFEQQFLMYKMMTQVPHNLWYQSKAWQWLINTIIWPISSKPFLPIIMKQQFFEPYYMNVPSCAFIVFFLNPLLLGIFFIVLVVLMYNAITKKNKNAIFILLAILTQFLPYLLFKRYGFIYYFYSVIPFIILGIAYLFKLLYKLIPHANKILFVYFTLNILIIIWLSPLIFDINLPGKTIILIYDSIQPLTLLCYIIILIHSFLLYRKIFRGGK